MQNNTLFLRTFITGFLIIFLSACSQITETGQPSKSDAKKVIQDSIETYYTTLPTKVEATPFVIDQNVRKAESIGIIRTVLKSGLNMGNKNRTYSKDTLIGDVFDVQITEKGKSLPHRVTPQIIAFVTMIRKVDDIVQVEAVDKTSSTVLFTYIGTPSEAGRAWFENKEYKWKGKAMIIFDPFKKQYVLDNLFYSEWNQLEWKPTGWIVKEDGDKLFLKVTKQSTGSPPGQ